MERNYYMLNNDHNIIFNLFVQAKTNNRTHTHTFYSSCLGGKWNRQKGNNIITLFDFN